MQLEKKFYITNSKKFVANNFSNAGFGAFFKNRNALPNLPLQSNFKPLLSSPVPQTGQKVYFRPQDLQKRPISQAQYPVETKNQSGFVGTGLSAPPAPARRVSARNLFNNNADEETGNPSVADISEKVETTANKIYLWANMPEETPTESNVASLKPKTSDLFTTTGSGEKKINPNEENKKFDETLTSSFLDNLSDTSNTPTTDNKNKENDKQSGLNEAIIVTKPSSSSDSNNNQLKPSGNVNKNVKICLNRQNSIDPALERPPGRLTYYDSDTNTISEGIMITSNLIKRSNSEYLHKKAKSIFLKKDNYLVEPNLFI